MAQRNTEGDISIDEVTAIVSPIGDTEAKAVYNLAGQMVNGKWSNGKSHRGINIIHHSDEMGKEKNTTCCVGFSHA